jgi:selenocysteine-specific elongation factor
VGLTRVGERVMDARHLTRCTAAVLDRVARFHSEHPLEDGMEREYLRREVSGPADAALFELALQRLAAAGTIVGRGSTMALATFRPTASADHRRTLGELTAIFAAAGLQAPELHELPPELAALPALPALLRFLERDGILVQLAPTRWAHAGQVSAAAAALRAQLPAGEPLTVGDFRDVLKLSRKHLIPLLEFFDANGITRRHGDARIISASAGGPLTV